MFLIGGVLWEVVAHGGLTVPSTDVIVKELINIKLLLLLFLNFDHYHPFLKKTKVHQVILYNGEKHVEGSFFRQLKCDFDRQKQIVKKLINKLLLQLLILLFRPSSLSQAKRNGISRKKKP